MSNLLSYADILKSRNDFRRSGGKYSDQFNTFDTPGTKYFKLFFYFNNGDSDGEITNPMASSGLLAPTWEVSGVNADNMYMYNTAYSYLIMNREDERAEQLKQFVNLLSNISSKSPWYFSEVSGVDAALERKQPMDNSFKVEDQRKKITIKCLPDAYDNRIGTLLELYRSIVWSWHMKREVLPSNLRKFDMGLFIFNDPVANFSILDSQTGEMKAEPGRLYEDRSNIFFKDYDANERVDIKNESNVNYEYSTIGPDDAGKQYKTSYKYIEFHNCEIDYNSAKTPWGTLSNTEGTIPQYTIDILFDDCYEYGYNEFNMQTFGDMILWDYNWSEESPQPVEVDLEHRTDPYSQTTGVRYDWMPNPYTKAARKNIIGAAVQNAIEQVAGTAGNIVGGVLKKAILGNLYTFSLTKLVGQAKSALQGNVWSTARAVSEYVNDAKQRNETGLPVGHSLFSKPTKILPTVKRIGNMNQAKSIGNNI